METPSWTAEAALVFAFDVGTTQSAASVVHCHPGQVPAPRVIPRWPSSLNSSKIPTSILYDKNGLSVALGAEAKEETMLERVADGQLTEARWFKLHLHPAVMQPPPYSLETSAAAVAPVAGQGSFEVPALPKNVTVQKCYADFLRYLFTGSKNWYLENAPDGESIWNKLGASVKIVLAHPNGWGLEEQAILKKAVVAAGITDLAATEKRLIFVTEAEASVHFGLKYSATTTTGWLKEGASFADVDSGGSTVDTCVYTVESVLPKLKLREAKTSDCTQSRATFVSRSAKGIIQQKLAASRFNTPEFIDSIVSVFDQKTKILFSGGEGVHVLKFGCDRDTDRACGIWKGRLTLTGAEIEGAFAPCVRNIIASVRQQISAVKVGHILLVGGFGESAYLQLRLRKEFKHGGTRIVTADEPSKKAVAEGAALYYIKDSVVARATRFEFGIASNRFANTCTNPDQRTAHHALASARQFYHGGWWMLCVMGTIIEADTCHLEPVLLTVDTDVSLLDFRLDVYTYYDANGGLGINAQEGWSSSADGTLYNGFTHRCVVTADPISLAALQPVCTSLRTGDAFKELEFSVGIFFGSTSLRASLV